MPVRELLESSRVLVSPKGRASKCNVIPFGWSSKSGSIYSLDAHASSERNQIYGTDAGVKVFWNAFRGYISEENRERATSKFGENTQSLDASTNLWRNLGAENLFAAWACFLLRTFAACSMVLQKQAMFHGSILWNGGGKTVYISIFFSISPCQGIYKAKMDFYDMLIRLYELSELFFRAWKKHGTWKSESVPSFFCPSSVHSLRL